jgi:glycerol uptake facilitator-like aquaporin
MFNFGKPKTAVDWIIHILGAIVATFLVWWMLRVYVL